jgi:hypothetical protein
LPAGGAEQSAKASLVGTWDDLVTLIADAIRLQLTYLSEDTAAVADAILRTLKMAGLSPVLSAGAAGTEFRILQRALPFDAEMAPAAVRDRG